MNNQRNDPHKQYLRILTENFGIIKRLQDQLANCKKESLNQYDITRNTTAELLLEIRQLKEDYKTIYKEYDIDSKRASELVDELVAEHDRANILEDRVLELETALMEEKLLLQNILKKHNIKIDNE